MAKVEKAEWGVAWLPRSLELNSECKEESEQCSMESINPWCRRRGEECHIQRKSSGNLSGGASCYVSGYRGDHLYSGSIQTSKV